MAVVAWQLGRAAIVDWLTASDLRWDVVAEHAGLGRPLAAHLPAWDGGHIRRSIKMIPRRSARLPPRCSPRTRIPPPPKHSRTQLVTKKRSFRPRQGRAVHVRPERRGEIHGCRGRSATQRY